MLNIFSKKHIRDDESYFELSSAYRRGYADVSEDRIVSADYSKKLEDPEFYKQEKIRQSELLKKDKIILKNDMGKKAGDLLSWSEKIFYSENFVKLLENNRFKGFKKYPITIISKNNLPQYYYLEFTYNAARVKEKINDYQVLYVLKNITDKKNHVYFDLKEYDGSDIFGVRDTGFTVISAKLKKTIEHAHLTNVAFEPIFVLK